MENIQALPLLPMRGIVAFPKTTISFDVVRPFSLRAVKEAMNGDKRIFLVAQKEVSVEKPSYIDLFKIGVIAKIDQVISMQNGMTRIMIEGLCRARLCEVVSENPFMSCRVEEIFEAETDNLIVNEGFMRSLDNICQEYFILSKSNSLKTLLKTRARLTPGRFADGIATNSNLDYKDKQVILEETDCYVRVEKLIAILNKEVNVLRISKEIDAKVKRNIDEHQKEYYLREELKVIEEELGEKEGIKGEADAYREKIASLKLKKEVSEKLLKDVSRFEKMQSQSPDCAVMRNYLDAVLSLPWNKRSRENADIERARAILEEDHYGLSKVKERILEYLAVRTLTKGKDGTVLCLFGPPGTGKTSIAKSIARALGRKYVRVSLGGIHDEADIRGHRKTYIGAMAGRIMAAISEAGTKNPLILLDEIDKMGTGFHGDPAAALLEVLDVEQNFAFRDHFIEVPFDLSEVMFITTANTLSTVSAPLLDRIEVVELSGYTNQEKEAIAKGYLVPKQIEKNGLSGKNITVTDEAISDIINYYTRESGVRHLERKIGSLMRKAAIKVLSKNTNSVKITNKNLEEYLGKRKFTVDLVCESDEVGIARGLAWTSVGGDTLSIEVNVMQGSGKLEITGNLGDIMKESAMAAVSYIRSKSAELGIYDKFYKTCDIHIHVPEGAVPKDGPSAGITMATAICSALTGRPVKRDVAMTGEVTLRGKVLPIGGLKEKSVAAFRAGIKTVIIPEKNKPDLEDVPKEVKDKIKFCTVSDMDKVLSLALLKTPKIGHFEIPRLDEKEKE